MLWKPSPSSIGSPAQHVQEQPDRDSDAVDLVDMWTAASLPIDLILEIFLRLDPAAVVCSAGVCKPWRRAIIDNASIIGTHLDRFFGPSLLLGIFQFHYDSRTAAHLCRMPGPFLSALPSNGGGGNVTPANSLVPAAASTALPTLLWCSDGFILLTGRSVNSLCLCNPVTGHCTIVPAAAARHRNYILLTAGCSFSSSSDDDSSPAVRILAMHRMREFSSRISVGDGETLAYQVLSMSGHRAAGVWSPVIKCSGNELDHQAGRLCVWMDHRSTAVGRDCVYWLAGSTCDDVTCVFALDVLTGRTWTTELPVQCRITSPQPCTSILSMSSDGRLTLIQSLWGPIIQVWELSSSDDDDSGGGDTHYWTLQRTIQIHVHNLQSHCPPRSRCRWTGEIPRAIYMSAFCPRSRCVIAVWSDQEFLVDIDSESSHPRVRRITYKHGYYCWPYEMDSSSTYISKLKHF